MARPGRNVAQRDAKHAQYEDHESPENIAVQGTNDGRGRERDKIELELGTLEERKAKEEHLTDKAAVYALSTAQPEHLKHLLVPKLERPLPVLLATGVKKSDDEGADDYRINFSELSTKLSVAAIGPISDTVQSKKQPWMIL